MAYPVAFQAVENLTDACYSADTAFGPTLKETVVCRGGFDFTFAFELYFFSIFPSCLLLVAAVPRLYALRQSKVKVQGKVLQYAKLGALISLAGLSLSLLVCWSLHGPPSPNASIAASALAVAASVIACLLSVLEHSRSLAPSTILNAYFLFSFLFDVVLLRTLWLSPWAAQSPARSIFTAVFSVKAVILCLEATEKRRFFAAESDRRRGPEDTSGVYSRGLFWWLNPLFLRGYRHNLTPDDLDPLSDKLDTKSLEQRFWSAWEDVHQGRAHDSNHRWQLLLTVVRAIKWDIFIPVLPRLLLVAFSVCQPLLVQRLLEYLQSGDGTQGSRVGYALIGAYFLVYLGMALSSGFYWTCWFRCLAMIRGMLMSAIFTKTTELSTTAADDKAAVTLMSTDVDRIVHGLREVNELWANVLQIGLATYLLERQLGYACIVPLVASVLSFWLITFLSKFTKAFQGKWISKVQARVATTSTLLGSMKEIKLAALTPTVEKSIANLRQEEVDESKSFRLLGAYTSTIALFPLLLAPVLTFGLYTIIALHQGSSLDVPRLFTSLSILLLISQPLFWLFGSVVNSRAAFACFERIEQFLLKVPRKEYRSLPISTLRSRPTVHEDSTVKGKDVSDVIPLETRSRRSSTVTSPPTHDALEMRNVRLGWKGANEVALKQINLKIRRSSITMVVGRSASGKTTLLRGILGELPFSDGHLYISQPHMAWCEQTPWLSNGTIRQNILGYSDFDETLYKSVIHACDLRQDLLTLAQGDETVVGSKGNTLSSGQKQRIALARAVYSKPEIALLDDVLSGLDTVTERKVFGRLLGRNGLLRRWGTTVLQTTNSPIFLPTADHIVVLADGSIQEQGSFADLRRSNGHVASIEYDFPSADGVYENEQLASRTASVQESTPDATKTHAPANATDAKPGKTEFDFSIYRHYIKSIGLGPVGLFLLLQAAWAFLSSFPLIWLKWWVEANTRQPNDHIGFYLGIYAALQVMTLLCSASLTWFCFSFMARTSGISLHMSALRAVMSAPMAFFDRTDTGTITTKFSQDMQAVDMSLPLQILLFVQNLFVCIAQAGIIASATGWIALSFPLLIAVFVLVQSFYLRTSKQMRILDLSERAPLYTLFLETLAGLATVRAFGWQHHLRRKNLQLVDRSQRPFYLLLLIQRWLTLVLDLITIALAVLVVGLAVGLRHRISAASIGVSLIQIITFTECIKDMTKTRASLETTLGAISRLKDLETETGSEDTGVERGEVDPEWPQTGHIQINGISAVYGGRGGNVTLKNVSLTVNPGERLGICGRTGSGKSSLVMALLRMMPLHHGSISIDGQDVSTLPAQTLRSRLNVLGPEPFFMAGSVRDNLDPQGTCSDEALTDALHKVQLWTHIRTLGGVSTTLNADSLSHGQRQLLCLARSLLRTSQVVILDEVTSNVDRETDKVIQRVIRQEFAGRTLITVAHRLDTILDCDRIAVMDQGECVELDRPEELLNCASRFRDLLLSYQERGEVD